MADAAPTPSASLRRPPPVHLDLIKADGDGPEADWLAEIERLLTLRAVTVGALVIEGQFFNSKKRMKAAHALSRLQARHGFTAFRLDTFDNRRLLGRSGWDVLSPRGTFARLDRLRVLERDAHEEEWLRLRLLESFEQARRLHFPLRKPRGEAQHVLLRKLQPRVQVAAAC